MRSVRRNRSRLQLIAAYFIKRLQGIGRDFSARSQIRSLRIREPCAFHRGGEGIVEN